MSSQMMHQIIEMIESEIHSRPSPIEFEMAYQARVAMDRIRFAIKHTEQFGPGTDPFREANRQLLDALSRLETVDRRFQERCRVTSLPYTGKAEPEHHQIDRRGPLDPTCGPIETISRP